MIFQPKLACRADWIGTDSRPPISFLDGSVWFAMMGATQRHGKFIADFLR
jgi:hypothetical protein